MHGCPNLADLCAGSPHRPLDWRFRLAENLAAGQLPDHAVHQADVLTHRAAVCLAGTGKPDCFVAAALALRTADPCQRVELEGRILARQSDADIARAMKLAPKAVSSYVALYLDIHTRLDREFWRNIAVYGPGGPRTLTTDDAEVLIRLAGLRLGVTGMLAIRDGLKINLGGLDPQAVRAVVKQRAALEWAWVWLQVQTLTDPAQVVAHWVGLHAESTSARGRTPDTQRLSDAVGGFLETLRADSAPEALQDPPARRAGSAKRRGALTED